MVNCSLANGMNNLTKTIITSFTFYMCLNQIQRLKLHSKLPLVYKIPYRRALGLAAFRPRARASKGILHTKLPHYEQLNLMNGINTGNIYEVKLK